MRYKARAAARRGATRAAPELRVGGATGCDRRRTRGATTPCAPFVHPAPLSPRGRGVGGEGRCGRAANYAAATRAKCHRPFLPIRETRRCSRIADFKSLAAEPGVTARVVLLVAGLVVLAAIELDDDAAVETDEIDDVVPDRNLSPKLEAGEATAAELAPDECLGLGLALAEVLSATAVVGHGNVMVLHGVVNCARGAPHPQPLSRGGERGDEVQSARRGATGCDQAAQPGRDSASHPNATQRRVRGTITSCFPSFTVRAFRLLCFFLPSRERGRG